MVGEEGSTRRNVGNGGKVAEEGTLNETSSFVLPKNDTTKDDQKLLKLLKIDFENIRLKTELKNSN